MIKLGYGESNYSVLMHLIKHLPRIREGILMSGDPNGLLEFIQMTKEIKSKKNLNAEVREKLTRVLAQFKTAQEKTRVTQLSSIDLEAKLLKGKAHMEELDAREKFEINARKSLVEDRNAKILMRRRAR